MNHTIVVALINNAALLLVLSVIYEITYFIPTKYKRVRPIASGILIAMICLAIMKAPLILEPGIALDTRSILISTTALFFGNIPTAITVATASVFRISSGGIGAIPGLAVIVTSALIGLAWRRWLNPGSKKWNWLNIYVMSLVVHMIMLACMLLLPYPQNLYVIGQIALPVMLIYPIAAILLSLLLLRQQEIRTYQKQLKLSEERFQMLFNHAPLGYQSLDANGYFINVNQQWLDTLGYHRDEVIGNWFGDFLAPGYQDAFRQRFPVFKAQGQIRSEFEMLHKCGKPIHIAFEGKIGYDLNGEFKQTHCILQDITELKKSEAALIRSELKYRRLFESMKDGILIIDAESGTVIDVNPSMVTLLGYSREYYINKTLWELELFKEISANRNDISELHDDRHLYYDHFCLLKADHLRVDVEVVISAYQADDRKMIQFNIRDITERKKAEEDLFYLSCHDYLTGLHNRRFFENEIKRIDVKSNLPISFITSDINGLKFINGVFGEEEGDRMIVQAAQILKSQVGENAVLARTGGDEFDILLPKTDLKTATEIIKNIRNAFHEYNKNLSNDSFHINLAFGVAAKENEMKELMRVMKAADIQMYQSKLLEKKSSHSAVLDSIKATMLEKSHETEAHAERLINLSRKISRKLNLEQWERDLLTLLATLHDIGKVGVTDQILNKPDKLDEEEWIEMKKHPEIGYRIAASSSELAPIADYILYHHERWDGNGYPHRISGKEIPLLSRIISVVDAFDAMTQDRPYRKAIKKQDAINEIVRNSGTQFDPEVVDAFLDCV